MERVPKAILILLKAGADINAENEEHWFWPGDTFTKLYWSNAGPASPEMKVFTRNCSAWEFTLSHALKPERIFSSRQKSLSMVDEGQEVDLGTAYFDIVRAMIEAGADVDATRPYKSAPRLPHRQPVVFWQSALTIMQSLQKKLRSGMTVE